MGTKTITWVENNGMGTETSYGSWTYTATTNDITITGDTFSILKFATHSAKYTGTNKGRAFCHVGIWLQKVGATRSFYHESYLSSLTGDVISWASGVTKSLSYNSENSSTTTTLQTSDFFNSGNANSKTVTISTDFYLGSQTENASGANYTDGGKDVENDTTFIKFILDAPPTFTHSSISYDTAYIYTGLTTASVTVSDLSAKYGGNITDVTFTIGNQSVSRTTAGTLSVLLDTVGTFTPTITVTDSRGQTATKALDPITVNGYVAPIVSFTAERTAQNGTDDDEGTYATVDATFRYTDVVTTLVAPSVVLTDDTGAQTTPTVTWYKTRASDGTLSGAFTDWSTVAYGDTVYGLIPNVSTQHSYQISIRPRDTEGTGTAIIQAVAPAFYTIDFLAGGHGIAFGQPSSQEGFFCNMDAYFKDKANIMRALFDFVYPVGSYYETSNTSFNPNTSWGGTWVLDSAGKVTVAYDSSDADFDNVGDSGGSKTHTHTTGDHTLTVDEIPSHTHNILAHYNSGSTTGYGMEVTSSVKLGWTASRIQTTGGGQAHNHGNTGSAGHLPPYVVVNRWHRTA